MTEVYTKKELCCGCSACKEICPKGAITMKPDEDGFLYPEIDAAECTDCGRCRKICPLRNDDSSDYTHEQLVFAARNNEHAELMSSQSGGAFPVFANHILSGGGTVYGAGYGEHFKVVHKRAAEKSEYAQMKGSKYVQSDINGTFAQAENDLKSGKPVLFTDTPCQIKGLKSYLGADYEKLITVDLVCRGVPSPLVWEKYLAYCEKKFGGKITSVNFRDKSIYGWRGANEKIVVNGKDRARNKPYYMTLFSSELATRPCCFSCRFSGMERVSEITIGDCWGIENIDKNFDASGGVSVIAVNNAKGKAFFDSVSADFTFSQITKEQAAAKNPPLNSPAAKPTRYDEFRRDFHNSDMKFILKKYASDTFYWNSYRAVSRLTKKLGIQKGLKKLRGKILKKH